MVDNVVEVSLSRRRIPKSTKYTLVGSLLFPCERVFVCGVYRGHD